MTVRPLGAVVVTRRQRHLDERRGFSFLPRRQSVRGRQRMAARLLIAAGEAASEPDRLPFGVRLLIDAAD
jgi:hypothetical protein